MSTPDTHSQALLADRMNGNFAALEISGEAFAAAYDTPDIGPHIEKDYKGLSYLSWPFAYRYLKQHFPSLYVAFEEKTLGEVVFGTPGAYYVRPYLTDGCRRTVALVFPIMDRKHNAIKELDGRAISDNCQRGAVKAIATFTGLGLRLYAGEDIPTEESNGNTQRAKASSAKKAPATEKPAIQASSTFDGKQSLVDFCQANPLKYEDSKACQMAVKNTLESVGLNTGANVKRPEDFANTITTLVAAWTKDKGVKVTKAEMTSQLDAIRAACLSSTTETIAACEKFHAAKK
ncbi:MAG: hypothetical protein CML73_02985 [Rhodobiaceae bacterium]|nr:hypothetical protein [Rhodobiaceae bacterium]